MFQTAELGQKVSRADFERLAAPLRLELLALQQKLLLADFPVILVFAGVDGAGKSESVTLINEWMDPHWIVTRAYESPSEEERERPTFWRFWRDLPPKGRIGLFLSCWYSQPILDRVTDATDAATFDRRLDRIEAFEKMLAEDGALILKFWMHLSKDAQKKRLKSLEKDPLQRWRVSKTDWRNWKLYDRFIDAAEHCLRRTGNGQAPWSIIEGEDSRFRSLEVLTQIRDGLQRHLASRQAQRALRESHPSAAISAAPPPAAVDTTDLVLPRRTILDSLDLNRLLGKQDYSRAMTTLQADLAGLARDARAAGVSTLAVFEGWDAAGKGGAIRRMVGGLDARLWSVIPFAAPTDEERAQHYLWRFWRHLPRDGRLTVFDRSWYGRVLVERVEGFAQPQEWMRAYAEINNFEEQIVHHGSVVVKFWLHISKEEQDRRFAERQSIPYKSWKLTEEDWRNRAKWDDYAVAVHDMVEKTSTHDAPWHLIEANDKNYARVTVLQTLCDALRHRLNGSADRT